jgi:hypothetical protein
MVYVRNRLEHWYLPLSAKPTAIGNKRRAKSGQLGVSIMCLGSETYGQTDQRSGAVSRPAFAVDDEGKKNLMNQLMYLSYSLNVYSGDEEEIKDTLKMCDTGSDSNPKFPIVNFPFLCSNIPAAPAYGVYISQLIRY